MACSKYEYVKDFELDDALLKSTFMVVRIDGRGFTKFTAREKFDKPNDNDGLFLMARSALALMENFDDIIFAYGQSDEFSFVLRQQSEFCNRRCQKIVSLIVSAFTSYYTQLWLARTERKGLVLDSPTFDGRVVLYPSFVTLRDYLSWRQADCHINNLFNYCYWLLVKKEICEHPTGVSAAEKREIQRKVHERVIKTSSGGKNEILFKEFGINYNKVPQLHRKGTIIYRSSDTVERVKKCAYLDFTPAVLLDDDGCLVENRFFVGHSDIISDVFWAERDHLLQQLTS